MDNDLRARIFERLKHSVQLLASPPDVQLRLLPDYVCRADELALEFDHWRDVTFHNYCGEVSSDEVSALTALDEAFKRLTALGKTEQGKKEWEDEAIRTSSEWQNIRHLAANALAAFGWPAEIPPSHADEYVSPAQFQRHRQN